MIDENISFIGERLCTDYQYEIIQTINSLQSRNFYIIHNNQRETSDALFELALHRAFLNDDHRILIISERKFTFPMRQEYYKDIRTLHKCNLRFKNDSQIICMSEQTKNNVHGLAVSTLIIDNVIEEDFSIFWRSLSPCVNLGGQIIISSAKQGISNSTIRMNFTKIDLRDKYKDCEVLL
jgi:hypothetical protein